MGCTWKYCLALCSTIKRKLPAGKNKYSWMTLQRSGKNFCAFNAQIYSAILDCRDGGLRNTCEFGQLALSQLLEFAQDAD